MAESRTSDPTAPETLERFRLGDEEAFRDLVEGHRRRVYAVARRLLRTHEDADEATQLAFLRAWKARESFRGDAAFGTWMTRIVLNVAKSMLAAKKPNDPLEDGLELVDPSQNARQGLELEQARRHVRAAVERLPERQRTVVLLKVFSEMTHREVAAAMELSEGAVKAHLHQAVANLRKTVAPVEAEVGDAN